jgi:hypothetical protein
MIRELPPPGRFASVTLSHGWPWSLQQPATRVEIEDSEELELVCKSLILEL